MGATTPCPVAIVSAKSGPHGQTIPAPPCCWEGTHPHLVTHRSLVSSTCFGVQDGSAEAAVPVMCMFVHWTAVASVPGCVLSFCALSALLDFC